MRILHITFSLENAGKENMLVDIAGEQQNLGNSVAIVVVNNKIDQNILNRIPVSIKTYLLNRVPGSRNPYPFIKLMDILQRQFRPDVVHAHDAHLGKILKKVFSGIIVLSIHGNRVDSKPIQFFDKLFAISKFVKADVEKRSNLSCQLIYNGIRQNEVKHRASYNIKNKFRIVHVSRLNHEIKGQDILIKGIHQLSIKKKADNLMLDLVGEGKSFIHLEKMITDLGLTKKVRLLGKRDREWVYTNLSKYHLFVHPSRFEPFGLVVPEAMAAGVPVVASDVGGVTEILENGRFGLLFKNNDFHDLANKIEQAIIMYKNGKIQKLAEDARQHGITNFDIKITAANYCRFYHADER